MQFLVWKADKKTKLASSTVNFSSVQYSPLDKKISMIQSEKRARHTGEKDSTFFLVSLIGCYLFIHYRPSCVYATLMSSSSKISYLGTVNTPFAFNLSMFPMLLSISYLRRCLTCWGKTVKTSMWNLIVITSSFRATIFFSYNHVYDPLDYSLNFLSDFF